MDDAKGYDGSKMNYLGVDELENMDFDVFRQLKSCLRSDREGLPVYCRATGMPGGPSQADIKKRYIIPTEYGKKTYNDPRTGKEIACFIGTVNDGACLQFDPDYTNRLNDLSALKRRQYLEGDWDAVAGLFFDGIDFDRLKMKPEVIADPTSGLYLSIDYGYGQFGVTAISLWYNHNGGCPP